MCCLSVQGQEKAVPESFNYKLEDEGIPVIDITLTDEKIREMDSLKSLSSPVSPVIYKKKEVDFFKESKCEKLPNGDKIYRIKIRHNAVLSRTYFKELIIENGDILFFYTEDKEKVFEANENFIKKKYTLFQPQNQNIILEYHQNNKCKKNKSKIIIGAFDITHIDYFTNKRLALQSNCNPNVKCDIEEYDTPINNELKDEISKSIILFSGYKPPGSSCSSFDSWQFSGAFINNTAGKIYVLTADHNLNNCYNVGDEIPVRIRLYYEAIECEDESTTTSEYIEYPEGGTINETINARVIVSNPTSDMALIKLASLPENVNILYSGYDASQIVPQEGIGIHHTQGLYKRFSIQKDEGTGENDGVISYFISISTNTLTLSKISSEDIDVNGSRFTLTYDIGAPRPVASSSPFFNSEGRIIGQLNGGSSDCFPPFNSYKSEYGRFWYSWNQPYDLDDNGTITSEETLISTLQPWLDPQLENEGITDGYEAIGCIDLHMLDGWCDTSAEPNNNCNMPGGWDDIWASPDLWNNTVDFYDPFDEINTTHEEPDFVNDFGAELDNYLLFNVRNFSACTSAPARMRLYWTMASTGEMWSDDWINHTDSDGSCLLGDEIAGYNTYWDENIITIPPIVAGEMYAGSVCWLPPNFTDPSSVWYPYTDPITCEGLSVDDEATNPKLEICLLARLQSLDDPIIGETQGPPYC